MICQVCKTNPVTIRGASTCSLKCATELDNKAAVKQNRPSDTFEVIRDRLPESWKRANPGLML